MQKILARVRLAAFGSAKSHFCCYALRVFGVAWPPDSVFDRCGIEIALCAFDRLFVLSEESRVLDGFKRAVFVRDRGECLDPPIVTDCSRSTLAFRGAMDRHRRIPSPGFTLYLTGRDRTH